jgi:hypothetical protein
MEPIARISSAPPSRRDAAPGAVVDEQAPAVTSPSTALVPAAPVDPVRLRLRPRPASAAFLAQLIAAKAHLPQARMRRRAEPVEATSLYGNVAKLRACAPGRRCAFCA